MAFKQRFSNFRRRMSGVSPSAMIKAFRAGKSAANSPRKTKNKKTMYWLGGLLVLGVAGYFLKDKIKALFHKG